MAWNAPTPYYYKNPNLTTGGTYTSLSVASPSDDPRYPSNIKWATSKSDLSTALSLGLNKAFPKIGEGLDKLGGSIFGAFGLGKVKPESVTGWETMPQYDYTYPRLEQTNNFIQENIDRLNQNKLPQYYDYMQPELYKKLASAATNRYYTGGAFDYGGKGDTSLANDTAAMRAMTKSKSRLLSDPINPLNVAYQNRGLSVSDLLTKMGVDVSYNETANTPAMSLNMPRGPESRWVSYTPTKKKFNSGEKITYNTNYGPLMTQRPASYSTPAWSSLF